MLLLMIHERLGIGNFYRKDYEYLHQNGYLEIRQNQYQLSWKGRNTINKIVRESGEPETAVLTPEHLSWELC